MLSEKERRERRTSPFLPAAPYHHKKGFYDIRSVRSEARGKPINGPTKYVPTAPSTCLSAGRYSGLLIPSVSSPYLKKACRYIYIYNRIYYKMHCSRRPRKPGIKRIPVSERDYYILNLVLSPSKFWLPNGLRSKV